MSTIPTDAEARRCIREVAPSLKLIQSLRSALHSARRAGLERVELSLSLADLHRLIESSVTSMTAYEACMNIAAERDALLAGAGSGKRRKRSLAEPTKTEQETAKC